MPIRRTSNKSSYDSGFYNPEVYSEVGSRVVTDFDPNAFAYLSAVEAADGQALEYDVKVAVNNFVIGCKADGIWTALKASCILAGARTLTGALVPLVGTAPTNNNFVSGDYNRETGLVGNGSTKYLNSNRSQTADPQNNHHLALHVTTTGTGTPIGVRAEASNSIGDCSIAMAAASSLPFRSRISAFDAPAQGTRSTVNATGFIALSRSSSGSLISRLSSANETITSTSTTPLTGNIGVFARIRADTSTVDGYANVRLAFYSIGESLDLALLDTRVTTLVNAIAAAIP
jgi:hypothetical protein